MNNLFPIFLIMIFSLFISIFTKTKSGSSIFISIFSIVSFLYIFYIFNLLKLGYLILLILALIFLTIIIYSYFTKKIKIKLLDFFTPSVFSYFIILIIIFAITKNSTVQLWDELRLWGAYPKLLFYHDDILLSDNSMLMDIMKSYPPALSLFQYFWTKTCGIFTDNALFFSYSIFGVSVFLPLFDNISWKKSYKCIPLILLSIIFPLLFFNSGFDYGHYYKTLFIDPILGMLFGYGMYLVYKNIFNKKEDFLKLLLIIIILVLCKDSGLMFSIILISSLLFRIILFDRKNMKDKLIKFLIILGSFVFILISWKITLKVYGITYNLSSPMNMQNIMSLLFNPTDNQSFLIKYFFDHLRFPSLVVSNYSFFSKFLTYQNLMIIFIILFILFAFLLNKEDKKPFILSFIFLEFANVVFMFGLILLYCLSLNNIESYFRYTNTIVLAISLFFVYILIEYVYLKNSKKFLIFTLVLSIGSFFVFPIRKADKYDFLEDTYYDTIKTCEAFEKIKDEKTVNVYVVADKGLESDSLYLHQLYYRLIDYNIFVSNFNSKIKSYNQFDNINAYFDYLYSHNIEYLYIMGISDNSLFLDITGSNNNNIIEEQKIYKLVNANDKIILQSI